MVVNWREREHKEVDQRVVDDPKAIKALWECGLLKFFRCANMCAQPQLLELLTSYWEPNREAFVIDDVVLKIEVEDIYFLTELSRRGETVVLKGEGVRENLTM
jgi:hypothetical protein